MNTTIPILNNNLEKITDYKVKTDMLSVEPDYKMLSEMVRWHLANKRQNTQHVRNRSMVQGAHRKLWRQKESHRARQGDGKACHFRGGGACFKIVDRNHGFKLNKKFKRKAMKMALHERIGNMFVLNNIKEMDLQKTKSCSTFVENILNMSKNSSKVTLCISNYRDVLPLLRGSYNLHKINVIPVANLNVLSSINTTLIFDKESIATLEDRLS